jgi:hypothetical protein
MPEYPVKIDPGLKRLLKSMWISTNYFWQDIVPNMYKIYKWLHDGGMPPVVDRKN